MEQVIRGRITGSSRTLGKVDSNSNNFSLFLIIGVQIGERVDISD